MATLRMPNVNHVVVDGRLTRDPGLRRTASGLAVCEITIANDRPYKDGDEWKRKTSFLAVTCWNQTAENVAERLRKGDPVLVQGRLDNEEWETKDGDKRSKTKITARSVRPLSWPDDDPQPQGAIDDEPF